jgi:hypothetical protein
MVRNIVLQSDDIPWNETIKKEARGIDDADFGEIQSVDPEYVITQKGIIDKEVFSFPTNLVQDYNYYRVLFKLLKKQKVHLYSVQHVKLGKDDSSNDNITTEEDSKYYLSNTKDEKL